MSIADKLTTIAENMEQVHKAGKAKEYNEFWDSLQESGTRTNYRMGFAGRCWCNNCFKPKYHINPDDATQMFSYSGLTGKLSDLLKDRNGNAITLDFSKSTSMQNLFMSSLFTEIGVVNHTSTTQLNQTFAWCANLTTIEQLVVKKTNTYSNTFAGSPNIVNLTIEGVIGQNGLSVSASTKLTHDSLMSIINALENKTGDTSGTTWKVTLGSANVAKLTTDELAQIRTKGWTYG